MGHVDDDEKMWDETNKVTPLEESIILWHRMSMTGSINKGLTIRYLYDIGLLKQQQYMNDCPLCEAYWDDRPYSICKRCPWPGIGFVRCERAGSPYLLWRSANAYYKSTIKKHEALKERASEVLALLKTLKQGGKS